MRLILTAVDRDAIAAEVEAGLPGLPPDGAALWRTIISAHG